MPMLMPMPVPMPMLMPTYAFVAFVLLSGCFLGMRMGCFRVAFVLLFAFFVGLRMGCFRVAFVLFLFWLPILVEWGRRCGVQE